MASFVSNYTLNRVANDVTSETVTVKLHTASPGSAGLSGTISGASEDVAAAGWTAASGGVSETTADTEFGVLSTSSTNIVTIYSLWHGANFIGWADLASSITVAANEEFTITAGTIELEFARA